MDSEQLLFRGRRVMSSILVVASMVLVAVAITSWTGVLVQLPTERSTEGYSNPTKLLGYHRALHVAPYEHTHVFPPPPQQLRPIPMVPNPGTEPPTWYFDDDEYYTDDGAISDSMIRQKKDLYEEVRSESMTVASTTTTNAVVSQDQSLDALKSSGSHRWHQSHLHASFVILVVAATVSLC